MKKVLQAIVFVFYFVSGAGSIVLAQENIYLSREFLRKNQFFHTESLTQSRMTFQNDQFRLYYDSITHLIPFEATGDFAIIGENKLRLKRNSLSFDEWRAESYGRPEIPEVIFCTLESDKNNYDYEYYLVCDLSKEKVLRFGISGLRARYGQKKNIELNCKFMKKGSAPFCKNSSSKVMLPIVVDRRDLKVYRRCFLYKLPNFQSHKVGKDELSANKDRFLGNAFYRGDTLFSMASYVPPNQDEEVKITWFLVRYNTKMDSKGSFSNELWVPSDCAR